MIDWNQFALLYGPMIPIFLFLLKAHRDIVYKTIPGAIKALRSEARKQRIAYHELAIAFRESSCGQGRRKKTHPKPQVKKPRKTPSQTKKPAKKKRP